MKKWPLLICILIITTLLGGCAATNKDCPERDLVKLRKMSPHRWRYYKHLMKEKALARENANSYEMMRKVSREGKKAENIEEWDCPRPGTKHQKLIREKRRKLFRMHDKKKSEKSLDELSEKVDTTD